MLLIIFFIKLLLVVFISEGEIIRGNCLDDGESCHFSDSCCSKRCLHRRGNNHWGSYCMREGGEPLITSSTTTVKSVATKSCLSFGNKCSSRRQCCSNRCDRRCLQEVKDLADYLMLMRSGGLTFCLALGSLCNENTDCCSGKCYRPSKKRYSTCAADLNNVPINNKNNNNNNNNNGTLVSSKARSCLSEGRRCRSTSECCSKKCDGVCLREVNDLSEYLILMRSVYVGFCLSTGTPCNYDSDCCSAHCVRVTGKPYFQCTSAAQNLFDNNNNTIQEPTLDFEAGHCQSDGRNCFMDDDCCSKYCVRVQFLASLSQFCAPAPPNSTEVINQSGDYPNNQNTKED